MTLFLSDPPRIHPPAFAVNAFNSSGWLWKGTRSAFSFFPLSKLRRRAARSGLVVAVLPWKHANNQTWLAFALRNDGSSSSSGSSGSLAFGLHPALFRYHRQADRVRDVS